MAQNLMSGFPSCSPFRWRGSALLSISLSALVVACASIKGSDAPGSARDGGGPPGASGGAPGSSLDPGSGGRVVVVLPDGGGPDEKFIGDTNQDATCGFDSFALQRAPVDLFVVLDRSASMQDDSKGDDANPDAGRPSKWDQLIPALAEVIGKADPSISWGLKTFPESPESTDGSNTECHDDTVTEKIDVTIAPMNRDQTSAAVKAVSPDGDGTPTGAAIQVAVTYLQGLKTKDPKYILLATDGEPSCSGTAGHLDKDSSDAKEDAVAAVSAAAEAGVHTFVIGVATKSSATSTLNRLATAGLEPRADSAPDAAKFYLASTQGELVETLRSIVAPIASTCIFTLTRPPPDPANIAVEVGDVKAPADASHADGWDYTDASHTQVQVFGSWCDRVKGGANMVQVVYGCPGFVIP